MRELMMVVLRRLMAGWGLTALLAYPMLFYTHKYAVPWYSMLDFRSYHVMVLHPLDFGVVRAPFAMRQLTALVANGILELGVIYPNKISFEHFLTLREITYSTDVFFALILANFLGLVSAGAFVYATVARDVAQPGRTFSLYGLLTVCLLLLSGPTLFHVVAPMTEGWTWCLSAAGLFFYRQSGRYAYLTLLVLPLAVFQREVLPLVFAGLSAMELLSRRGALEPDRRRFLLTLLAASVAAVLAYYLLRGHILPVFEVDGRQLSPAMWWRILMQRLSNPDGMARIATALMKLNLVYLWGIVSIIAIRRGLRGWSRHFLYALMAVSAVFALLALSTGAELSIDRYVAMMTPMFAVSTMEMLLWLNRTAERLPVAGDA